MAQQNAMQDMTYDVWTANNNTSGVLYLNANQGAQSYTTADLGIK